MDGQIAVRDGPNGEPPAKRSPAAAANGDAAVPAANADADAAADVRADAVDVASTERGLHAARPAAAGTDARNADASNATIAGRDEPNANAGHDARERWRRWDAASWDDGGDEPNADARHEPAFCAHGRRHDGTAADAAAAAAAAARWFAVGGVAGNGGEPLCVVPRVVANAGHANNHGSSGVVVVFGVCSRRRPGCSWRRRV